MAKCRTNRSSRKKRTCIGERDKEITIKVRHITPPANVNYDNVFGDIMKIFARIQTTNGQAIFDEVSLREVAVTHIFDIPFLDNLTISTEDWIEHNGNNYRILTVKNVNENNIDWLIRASFKGPANVVANKA